MINNEFKKDLLVLLNKHEIESFVATAVDEEDHAVTMIQGNNKDKLTFLAVELAKDTIKKLQLDNDEPCDCPNCSPKKQHELSKDDIQELVSKILTKLKKG